MNYSMMPTSYMIWLLNTITTQLDNLNNLPPSFEVIGDLIYSNGQLSNITRRIADRLVENESVDLIMAFLKLIDEVLSESSRILKESDRLYSSSRELIKKILFIQLLEVFNI
jgi:hypothetical protein